MRIAGIIAEYNPFHNGHKWQIEEIRRCLCPDYVVAVMSPDVVQRGEPALLDKYTRAKLALSGGVDLILELPAAFAVSGADSFADGAVAVLAATGIVTHLVFGAESDDLSRLQRISFLLEEEPESFRQILSDSMKEGMSFAGARAHAALSLLPADERTEAARILRSPNCILGLSYLRALLRQHISIEPVPLLRQGEGHHSSALSGNLSSASAIRKHLLSTCEDSCVPHRTNQEIDKTAVQACPDWHALSQNVPESTLLALRKAYDQETLLSFSDLSLPLHLKLLTLKNEGRLIETVSLLADGSEKLAHRLFAQLPSYQDAESFVRLLHAKNWPDARIRRLLLQVLLDVGTKDIASPAQIRNLQALGVRRESQKLLSLLEQHASVPVCTHSSTDACSLRSEMLCTALRTAKSRLPLPDPASRFFLKV